MLWQVGWYCDLCMSYTQSTDCTVWLWHQLPGWGTKPVRLFTITPNTSQYLSVTCNTYCVSTFELRLYSSQRQRSILPMSYCTSAILRTSRDGSGYSLFIHGQCITCSGLSQCSQYWAEERRTSTGLLWMGTNTHTAYSLIGCRPSLCSQMELCVLLSLCLLCFPSVSMHL